MGRLRIIAGEMKGRRIEVLTEPGLRPTPERVREALFSILGERVAGATALDAYAGSGALGFESISRGARHVTFVDASPSVVRALGRTQDDLDCRDRSRVVQGDPVLLFEQGLLAGPFDLVLADPPYGSGDRSRFIGVISGALKPAPDGLLVVESDRRENPLDEEKFTGLTHIRRATYGRTALDFFRPGGGG